MESGAPIESTALMLGYSYETEAWHAVLVVATDTAFTVLDPADLQPMKNTIIKRSGEHTWSKAAW